jgi:hypothetical protein
MNQWSTYVELETCLLACMLLYLNLLALSAYAGLVRGHGAAAARGKDAGGEGVPPGGSAGVWPVGRPAAAAVVLTIGLIAALALAARLVWLQV